MQSEKNMSKLLKILGHKLQQKNNTITLYKQCTRIPLKTVVTVLGILLDDKLIFTNHYDNLNCKTNITLGCVSDWYSPYTENIVFFWVRSTLKNNPLIWSP